MLKKLLPILITLIAVGGAGYVALQLKGPRTVDAAMKAREAEGGGEHGGGGGHGDDHGKVVKVHGEEEGDAYGYLDFRRNFIIPVMGDNRVDALVLLTFSVEMEADKIEEARTREPRIRDAFMKQLLSLSHEGVFNQDITDPDVYNVIQERLLETAREVVDENVKSILLVDFARQDQ